MLKSGCAPGTMSETIKGGVVCVIDCEVHVSKDVITRTVMLFTACFYLA